MTIVFCVGLPCRCGIYVWAGKAVSTHVPILLSKAKGNKHDPGFTGHRPGTCMS
jgi:hypothetical protein